MKSALPPSINTAFIRTHLGWPLLAFIGLNLILLGLGGDQWFADRLYAVQGHAWRLQHGFITESLVHVGGKRLSVLAWLAVGGAWAASFACAPLRQWRTPLWQLALSVLLATSAVALLKGWTNVDCPWDLVRYGGSRHYLGLFEHRPANYPVARCFPAGHASAGYAWVALYFFFRSTRPSLRGLGLATGLVLGLVFGFSQQLRGAHFLSHDLFTLAICWSIPLGGCLLSGWLSDATPHVKRRSPPTRSTSPCPPRASVPESTRS